MITIKYLTDINKILELLKQEDMCHIVGLPLIPDDYIPNTSKVSWVEALNDDVPTGLVMLRPLHLHIVEFHGGILKEFRHKNSYQLISETLEELRKILKCKFVTTFPEHHIPILKFVKHMKYELKDQFEYNNQNYLMYGEV